MSGHPADNTGTSSGLSHQSDPVTVNVPARIYDAEGNVENFDLTLTYDDDDDARGRQLDARLLRHDEEDVAAAILNVDLASLSAALALLDIEASRRSTDDG